MKKNFSKIVIVTLAILIAISSVSLGKVFAYFSSSSSASGTVTMGHLSISDIKKNDGTDINWNITNLQPNQSFGGSYKVEVTSNINYYIRILFKANVTPLTGKSHATNCGDNVTDDTDILNIVIDGAYTKSDTKTSDGYTAYYKLSPTKVTSATTTETFSVDLKAQNWVGSGSCDYYMGATVSINMQVEVMQADYLNSQAEGGTMSSATTMHTLWGGILENLYSVTISNNISENCEEMVLSHEDCSPYNLTSTIYYAVDGENTWHALDRGTSVTLLVEEAVLFSMHNTVEVDWAPVMPALPFVVGTLYIRAYMGTEYKNILAASVSYKSKDGIITEVEDVYDTNAYQVGYVITEDAQIEITQHYNRY